METGRKHNKELTSINGSNLTNSSTQAFKVVEVDNIPVETSGNLQYKGESESINTLSGVGSGESGGASGFPHKWGHTMPSGTRLEINDADGGERIDIVHASGAGIAVDSDGAVFIVSKSKRGGGLNAPFGDIHISAGGDIVINGGASLSIMTKGDLNLDVGGTIQARSENFNLITKSYNVTVDGAASTNVTTDNSVVVGGIDRKTVAGDSREQVTGQKILDIGADYTSRIGANHKHSVKTNYSESVGADYSMGVTGKSTESVKSDKSLSVGAAYSQGVTGAMSLSSDADVTLYSGAETFITGSGTTNIKSGGAVKIDGSAVNVSPAVDRSLWADEAAQAGQASVLGGSIGSKPPEQSAGSGSANAVEGPEETPDAEVMDANDIVDTLTSARKYPEYPGNGVLESASVASMSSISHDETNGAQGVYDEYSSGNSGNPREGTPSETIYNLPEESSVRADNIESITPSIGIPSQTDLGAKISKHFTLGMLLNGNSSDRVPSSVYESVVKNHILAAVNVLDPIKEKFPAMLVTSAYRFNSPNHKTGKAIDFVIQSRDHLIHAEMARFVRDNLPIDQVFLERNTSAGKTHVHIRVAEPGWKGRPVVLTCADPKCRAREPGINVTYLEKTLT